ncbi:ricin-type beta-trefoil lectin domain protein [Nonomuraea sp. NPDC001636]|uniref:ricin-type beta-trefoil lectin domain protein n=1 Tax=Nonomuraea sp. NPDC001636 TaxID=3154391 RepID=UPI00332DC21C
MRQAIRRLVLAAGLVTFLVVNGGAAHADPLPASPSPSAPGSTDPTPDPTAEPTSEPTGEVTAQANCPFGIWPNNGNGQSLVLDVDRAGGSGSKTIVWTWNGGANQRWEHGGQTNTTIVPCHNRSLCLDAAGGQTANGTWVIVYRCNGGWNQRWDLEHPWGAGWVRFRLHGTSKCLNVNGGIARGHNVILWPCNNEVNERWTN